MLFGDVSSRPDSSSVVAKGIKREKDRRCPDRRKNRDSCDHAGEHACDQQMAQTVEISLRIPSLRVRREGKEAPETIANNDVRFGKRVELMAIPKPGDILTMTVSSGGTFECDVVRSDWQHDKNIFVISCRYSKRSISPAEYQALIGASDWQVRALL